MRAYTREPIGKTGRTSCIVIFLFILVVAVAVVVVVALTKEEFPETTGS